MEIELYFLIENILVYPYIIYKQWGGESYLKRENRKTQCGLTDKHDNFIFLGKRSA